MKTNQNTVHTTNLQGVGQSERTAPGSCQRPESTLLPCSYQGTSNAGRVDVMPSNTQRLWWFQVSRPQGLSMNLSLSLPRHWQQHLSSPTMYQRRLLKVVELGYEVRPVGGGTRTTHVTRIWLMVSSYRGDIALDEAILDAHDDLRSSIYYV